MIRDYFHRWEQELAAVSKSERTVRPFEWGHDWIEKDIDAEIAARLPDPGSRVARWVEHVMKDSDAFFTPEPTRYTFTAAPDTVRASGEEGVLTFASGFTTPHEKNNTVVARYFPAKPMRGFNKRGAKRAVVVLAQWNSDAEGHIGLCKLLSKLGVASLRISLPYHDARMPPELTRADYIVSANVGRTAQICRQAVLDARRASSTAWRHTCNVRTTLALTM